VFTDLIGYCRPGAAYDVVFSVSGLHNSSVTQVSFQSCLKGDEGTGQSCTCPPEASRCVGSDISLKPGYWRISPLSVTVTTCTLGTTACTGGNGTGDALCAVGYSGPLCAVCASGFVMNSLYKTCDACVSGKPAAISIVLIVLLGMVVFLAIWRVLVLRGEIVLLNLADYVQPVSSRSSSISVLWRPLQWFGRIRAAIRNLKDRLSWVGNCIYLFV
jgi:hypothetical protein